jgi:biopolymer transport protein ExbD
MVRISLTPIIDVVFILLIFFMLATNFQSFNQTDIKLSNEEASTSQSDKRIYLVEFNKEGEFKLNKATMSPKSIKNKILDSKKKDEEYIVVIKGAKDTEIQDILNVIADFKKNDIKEITIGISKNDLDENYENEKKSVDMPLLEKL